MYFKSLLKFCGAAAILLIALLSLVPGQDRPHTGAPGQVEHIIAYCLTALWLGMLVPQRVHKYAIAACLVLYAGVLETLQLWIPGRTSQFIDFAASSSGVLIGILLSGYLTQVLQQKTETTGGDPV
jgi:VanZ family protein